MLPELDYGKRAIINYCENNNLKFKIFDVYINSITIYKLWQNETVVFDKKTLIKVKKWYKKSL